MTQEKKPNQVAQTQRFNFVAFARDPAYREANMHLLRRAFSFLPSPFFQVDLASGTGLVAQVVSTLCEETGKVGTVIGIDPDRYAVESASQTTPSTAHCSIEFVQGRAQDIDQLLAGKIPAEGVDYVSIHDAIHEIEEDDKRDVIAAVSGILKPGGLFTYNSAFTTAALEQSAMLWGKWKAKAFALLEGRRNRQVKGVITHTPEEYRQMITEAGLAVIHDAKESVKMSRAALEAIAQYPRFIYGVFADLVGEEKVSLEEKSQALIDALHELDVAEIPRVWHELIARKPLPSGS